MNTWRINRILLGLMALALLITFIPPATTAAPPEQGTVVYIVQWGDTLFSISRRFGTTVPAIMTANNLTTEAIYAGQRLTIPIGATTTPLPPPTGFTCKYTVQWRDTVYSIAWRYKVAWQSLMQANNLLTPYITVGMSLNVPCLTPTPPLFPVHEVKAGENLFRIAIHYKTSVYAIAVVNGLWSTHWIYAGQKLVIPYPDTVQWRDIPPVGTPGTPTPTRTPVPGSPVATATPQVNAYVTMRDNIFDPASLTIRRGQVVQWKNLDTKTHTVVSGKPNAPTTTFRSSALGKDQVFTFKFETAGTFDYYSDLDSNMTGKITVE